MREGANSVYTERTTTNENKIQEYGKSSGTRTSALAFDFIRILSFIQFDFVSHPCPIIK